MVDEFLKTKKNIQRNQLVERLGEQHAMAGFTRQFKPITDVQKDISQNIVSEIKNLPKAIDFPREYKEYTPAIEGDVPEMIGPIAASYLRKFASKDVDTVYGIYDNKGKCYIGDTRVGIIDDNIIVGEKEYLGTSSAICTPEHCEPSSRDGTVKGNRLESETPLPWPHGIPKNPFRYFKASPEIIQLAVMMYVRFPLSLRNAERHLYSRLNFKKNRDAALLAWRDLLVA